MKLDHHILAVVEPTIRPADIKFDSIKEEEGNDRQTKSIASLQPFLRISSYDFTDTDILSFTLSLDNKIPMVEFTVVDRKKLFDSEFYPRGGDCVTVFLNSKNNDTFKTIHMDFELLEVEMRSSNPNETPTISCSGHAKIPNLYAEVCKHYDEGPSIDHVELIAKDLKLGLATNITETQDKQIRIQPWVDYITFINEVVASSHVSEESFTTWYIDQFYYLNFIDINRIFDSENPPLGEIQANFIAFKESMAEKAKDPETDDNLVAPLMLTNDFSMKMSTMYIEDYRIVNNAAYMNALNGYGRTILFYDDNGDAGTRRTELQVQPFVSKSMPDSDEPLRGSRRDKQNENRTETEFKHKWFGRQDCGEDGLGNTHPNALYAQLVDHQNQAEVQKMKLVIRLGSFNPSLYKYQKLPIMLYDTDPKTTKTRAGFKEAAEKAGTLNDSLTRKDEAAKNAQVQSDGNPDMVLNHMLSGYYIIENINYTYLKSTNRMVQEITLIRREWPGKAVDISAQIENSK
jgi:hypothetical protein